MALIKLNAVSLAYGHVPLLDKVDLQIEDNERVCLVGRNGTGKSTLMQIIRGVAAVDDGEVWRKPGLRIAWLAQEVPENLTQSVFDVVAAGLDEIGATLAEYHHLIQTISDTTDESVMDRLSELQHYLDTHDGWRLEQRVAAVISRLQLPEDVSLAELSGGMKRRVMLAQALVTEPDLLLLDEPTNHLDLAGIQWLEEFLLEWNGSLLFITHDRRFLQNVATRIIELDRGNLSSWPGDYQNFIEQKEHALSVEAEHNAKFDKKLAQEEVWIRQGVKARRTRNEGRVRALEALRRERSQRREQQGKVAMNLDSGETSGKIVIEVEHASVGYAGKPVIRDFSTRIMRGDKVGIIGPNGVGKTTLLKLLLGQLAPDSGKVTLGTKLEIAYFDQQREQLDANKTVLDNLNMGSDVVTVNGRDRHVMSYLQDFLFVPARVRSPVSSLSGGERNRLLLARLFTRPANVLVMDEPTNDLDVETLELLEELLIEYPGTLLLVSHDRTFLDNVITNSLVFEGDGRVEEYVGGYSDWLRQRDSGTQTKTTPVRQDHAAEPGKNPDPMPANSPARSTQSEARPTRTRKLSYKQQRELEQLPGRIEALEIEQQELQAQMAAADFYKGDQESIAQTLARLEQVTQELETCLQRWVVLEGE